MTAARTYSGWAVDSRSHEGHGLLGVLWFSYPHPEPLPLVLTSMFPTREAAREAVREHKRQRYQPFPFMRPVRVRITVEVDE
jgi:hypothetical protein